LSRRRWPGRDRGSFTVEVAVGLPALMVLLFAALACVGAVITKGQCVDAAREGAVAAARGESGHTAAVRVAPPGATISISIGADTVTVSVQSRVPMLGTSLPAVTVDATAVAALEPQSSGVMP
jgi:Flp pilus assembly protein TadG